MSHIYYSVCLFLFSLAVSPERAYYSVSFVDGLRFGHEGESMCLWEQRPVSERRHNVRGPLGCHPGAGRECALSSFSWTQWETTVQMLWSRALCPARSVSSSRGHLHRSQHDRSTKFPPKGAGAGAHAGSYGSVFKA